MNAIERAARALCKAEGNPENTTFEGKPMWRSYLPQVRLVLAAIQQADSAMIDAGNQGMRDAWAKRGLEAPATAGDAAVDEAWQAMIDVMLDACG
ncbi:MAG TPA: hypothetical protein VJM09_14185 [Sphingobium sp.]|nr:hypothetical protein [Sphingobium sp.]